MILVNMTPRVRDEGLVTIVVRSYQGRELDTRIISKWEFILEEI